MRKPRNGGARVATNSDSRLTFLRKSLKHLRILSWQVAAMEGMIAVGNAHRGVPRN